MAIQDKASQFAINLCELLQPHFHELKITQAFKSDIQALIEEYLCLHVKMLESEDEYTLFWANRGAVMQADRMFPRYIDTQRNVELHILSSLSHGIEKTYMFGGDYHTNVIEKAEVLTTTHELVS